MWELLEYSLAGLGRDPGRGENYNKTEAISFASAKDLFAFQSSPYKSKLLTGSPEMQKPDRHTDRVSVLLCGNYWIRTSDPLLVRQVL